MALKTDYKDYQFQEGETLRKYQQISNGDGTISLKDVTSYQQEGDRFSASDINATNAEVNKIAGVQEITLGTSWSDGLQTVSVPGITENDSPILDVKLNGDFDTVLEQQAEWNKIVQATTGNGTITFLSSEDTTMQLTILVKGK